MLPDCTFLGWINNQTFISEIKNRDVLFLTSRKNGDIKLTANVDEINVAVLTTIKYAVFFL